MALGYLLLGEFLSGEYVIFKILSLSAVYNPYLPMNSNIVNVIIKLICVSQPVEWLYLIYLVPKQGTSF